MLPPQVHRSTGQLHEHDPADDRQRGLRKRPVQDVDGSAGTRLHTEQLARLPEDVTKHDETQASDLYTQPSERERDQGPVR